MVEFTEKILQRFSDLIASKLDEIKPKDVQIVEVRQNPDSFSYSELDKQTTTNQKWSTKDFPIIKFENRLFASSIVKSISLRPDTLFKTKGKIIVTVDDSEVFVSKGFNSFEDVIDLVIPVNKTIEQDSLIKIFMISSDGSIVGMTVLVSFGG